MSPEQLVSRSAYSDRVVRFIAVAPLLASILIAAVQMTNATGSRGRILVVVGLACCLMAPHLHQLWALAHAERPRAAGWTLALVLVAYIAGLPLAGVAWPLMGVQVLISVVIVLPRPWSLPAAGLVGLAMLIVVQVFYPGTNPLWTIVVILDRSGACLALAWLSAALRQLLAAREELAVKAVLRERVRIDAELAETVGTALGTIAGRGAAISRLAGTESALAAEQLRTLVEGSRQTLAETRRMIRTYQRGSLRAELDTAVALLGAAGIVARLDLPAGGLTEAADEVFAASLRAVVDRLLHDGSVTSCRLRVVQSAGGLQLLVDADGSGQVESA